MSDLTSLFNVDYVRSWAGLPDNGPMWALNLMRYRPLATYADNRHTTLSGLEADNLYMPHGPLGAVGARIVLLGPVERQLIGDATTWDRIALVQYPSRMAMAQMLGSEEFRELLVHKDAGMEFTLNLATFPQPSALAVPSVAVGDRLLLDVVADPTVPGPGVALRSTPLARFDVEDAISTDGRRWAEVRWDVVSAEAVGGLPDTPRQTDVGDRYTAIVRPDLNWMSEALAPAGVTA